MMWSYRRMDILVRCGERDSRPWRRFIPVLLAALLALSPMAAWAEETDAAYGDAAAPAPAAPSGGDAYTPVGDGLARPAAPGDAGASGTTGENGINLMSASVPYLDERGLSQTCPNATDLMGNEATLSSGWYLATATLAYTGRLAISGDVHIILADSAHLDASNGGINVGPGNSLTIYAQSVGTDMGMLTAISTMVPPSNTAGIGGGNNESGGAITINGGTVNATGGWTTGMSAAGIGGGHNGTGGIITINGGNVNATGPDGAAGIGGGQQGAGGTITINGGTVTALTSIAAGIGGGYDASGGIITINGGTVTATSYVVGAGIGGGYKNPNGAIAIDGGTIAINGGTVTANGGMMGAGIGGGNEGSGGVITINGGTVTANGGMMGAGIGGGGSGAGGSITIGGGTVTANGGMMGAGIGGGNEGSGGTITISGGDVTANGGGNAAGIGDGHDGSGGTVAIDGGSVTAIGTGTDAKSFSAQPTIGMASYRYKTSTSESDPGGDYTDGAAMPYTWRDEHRYVEIRPLAVDFSELDEKVADANGISKGDYTDDSWKHLQDAIAAADAVRANPGATQTEVDAAAAAIIDAMDNLVRRPGASTPIVYTVIEHFGTWTGSGTRTARVDADNAKFVRLVRQGGQGAADSQVPSTNYTVTQGSTVITLAESYIKTLADGTYLFTAEFTDGCCEDIRLVVDRRAAVSPPPATPAGTDSATPRTGDSMDAGFWWLLLAIAGGLLCLFLARHIRHRKTE